MMTTIAGIVSNTPWWVWLLFCYVIFLGINALFTRVVFLPRLLVLPLVFLGLRFSALCALTGQQVLYALLPSLLVGIISFWWYRKKTVYLVPNRLYCLQIPGTYTILLFSLLYFVLRYFFGFLKVVYPVAYQEWSLVDHAVGLLFIGYMIGMFSAYAYQYFFLLSKQKDR